MIINLHNVHIVLFCKECPHYKLIVLIKSVYKTEWTVTFFFSLVKLVLTLPFNIHSIL